MLGQMEKLSVDQKPVKRPGAALLSTKLYFPQLPFLSAAEIESAFLLLWYREMHFLSACMYGLWQRVSGLCLIHLYLTCTLRALFSLLPLKCLCQPGWAWMEGWDEGKRDSEGQREMQGEGLKCSRCFYIMARALFHSISCPGKPDITHTHMCALSTFSCPTKMLEKLSPWQPLPFLIAVMIKRKNDGGCLGEMSHDASDFSTNHLFILATFTSFSCWKSGIP